MVSGGLAPIIWIASALAGCEFASKTSDRNEPVDALVAAQDAGDNGASGADGAGTIDAAKMIVESDIVQPDVAFFEPDMLPPPPQLTTQLVISTVLKIRAIKLNNSLLMRLLSSPFIIQ